ncbi:MAG: hypothetical protein QMC95_01180 [Desulfitobacteriaceae bacterium]|nr:hypothetical protein [Desulfitobacteriaceae bacterium]MDI6912816.1 hypothetical protein [Desulfitobacteriaceae bacterium]
MLIGTFLFYFILFVFIFSSPKLRNRFKSKGLLIMFAVPAILGLIMAFLTVLKVYFIYKLLVLLFAAVTFYLTYLEWGGRGRKK